MPKNNIIISNNKHIENIRMASGFFGVIGFVYCAFNFGEIVDGDHKVILAITVILLVVYGVVCILCESIDNINIIRCKKAIEDLSLAEAEEMYNKLRSSLYKNYDGKTADIAKMIMSMREKAEKAEDYYKACSKKGFDENNAEGLRIISENLGIKDCDTYEKLKELFLKGKQTYDNNQLSGKKQREKESFEKDQKLLSVAYHDKYLYNSWTAKFMNIAVTNAAALTLIHSDDVRSLNSLHEHDSALRGGIAAGVAGTFAGVAEVIHTENENARIREIRQDTQRRINDSSYLDSQREADNYKRVVDNFKSKLCDKGEMQQKYELLKFYDWDIQITDTGNIRVKGKVELVNDVTIVGKKGILDGSLKIDVVDSAGNVVAMGYYHAPGFGDFDKLSNQSEPDKGFGCENGTIRRIDIICIVTGNQTINSAEGLQCRINPEKMWTIEYFDSIVSDSIQ